MKLLKNLQLILELFGKIVLHIIHLVQILLKWHKTLINYLKQNLKKLLIQVIISNSNLHFFFLVNGNSGVQSQKTIQELEKKMKEMEKTIQNLKSGASGSSSTIEDSTSTTTEEVKITPVVKIPKEVVKRKKTTPVVDSRPMLFEEKKLLSANISELDAVKLTKVVEIIQSRAPKASSQSVESEIEIDLDKLDAVTLRQIEKYIKTALGSKRKTYVKTKPKPIQTSTASSTSTSSVVKQETSQLPPPPQTISKIEQNRKLESSSSDSSSSDSDSDSDEEKKSNPQEGK